MWYHHHHHGPQEGPEPGDRGPAEQEPQYEFLDPARVRLFRDDFGRLRMTVQDDRSYLDVKVVRAFPLSDPDRYYGLLTGRDGVIGIVAEPQEMDEQSRRLAAEALERHYFVPTILKINSMKEEFGAMYCDVETDRGQRQFVAKGLRDSMEEWGEGELMFADMDGNRYRVADWRRLDVRSQRFLERVV
jgi:hypothetical protein